MKPAVESIENNTNVQSNNRVLLAAAVNDTVRSQLSIGQFMASAASEMMVEEHQISGLVKRKLGTKSKPIFGLLRGGLDQGIGGKGLEFNECISNQSYSGFCRPGVNKKDIARTLKGRKGSRP